MTAKQPGFAGLGVADDARIPAWVIDHIGSQDYPGAHVGWAATGGRRSTRDVLKADWANG